MRRKDGKKVHVFISSTTIASQNREKQTQQHKLICHKQNEERILSPFLLLLQNRFFSQQEIMKNKKQNIAENESGNSFLSSPVRLSVSLLRCRSMLSTRMPGPSLLQPDANRVPLLSSYSFLISVTHSSESADNHNIS